MAFLLYGGEGAGLSNNGDYTRIMKTNSLFFVTPVNVPYVYQSEFRMNFEGDTDTPRSAADLLFSLDGVEAYPSVHLVFIRASMAANMALNTLTGAPLETYRVQLLGFLYLLCYAGLFVLLFSSFSLPKAGVDLLVKLLLLAVLCDEGYVTYFNSLYSEPVQMLGLLAVVVFALRAFGGKGRLWVNALWLCLSCLLYGWSKFVNLPVAMLCIVLLGTALFLAANKKTRITLTAWGLICITTLGAIYLSLPKWMDEETNYNAVFFGVLKDATPEQQVNYLSDLGLPHSLSALSYSSYYSQRGVDGRGGDAGTQSAMAFEASFAPVSKPSLLLFYLRHPALLLSKVTVSIGHSGFIRPYYLSNLGENHVRLSFLGRFAGWSYLRGQLPLDTWAGNGLVIALGSFALWRLLRKREKTGGRAPAILVLLTVLGSLSYHLVIPVITNGEADLAKHMFAFAQIIDLLALLTVARMGYWLCGLRRVRYPAGVLAGVLVVAAALFLALPASFQWIRVTRDTVSFGTWEGRPITWQIVEREGDRVQLLATEAIAVLPFSTDDSHGFGHNLWQDSSLREWLNGEFLTHAFTPSEREVLLAQSHSVLLSGSNLAHAQRGYNDFYAFHIPRYSDRGHDIAYAKTEVDVVSLPDIAHLASLSRAGRLPTAPCWMDTPYYSNSSMLRILASDGYFYMRDAAQPFGVRPLISIQTASVAES